MRGRKKTSPWLYVSMGCGCLVLLVAVGFGVAGVSFFRWAKDVEATMKDPVKRADKTQSFMGYERVPEGYHPTFAMSILRGWVMDIAMLADREPDEDGELRTIPDRMFLLMKLGWMARWDGDLRDVIEGRAGPAELFEKADLRVDADEAIGDGTITVDGFEVRYASHRGGLSGSFSRSSHGGHGVLEGIMTMAFVDCPDGQRPALCVWLEPDPQPGDAVDAVDLTGTPADPQALEQFLSQFALCSG